MVNFFPLFFTQTILMGISSEKVNGALKLSANVHAKCGTPNRLLEFKRERVKECGSWAAPSFRFLCVPVVGLILTYARRWLSEFLKRRHRTLKLLDVI